MGEDSRLHKFEAVESRLALDKGRVCGVNWWDLLRYPIFLRYKGVSRKDYTERGRISKFIYYIFCLLDIFKYPLGRKFDLMILGHPRHKIENGKEVDIYVDPLLSQIKSFSYLRVEKRLVTDRLFCGGIFKVGFVGLFSSLIAKVLYPFFSNEAAMQQSELLAKSIRSDLTSCQEIKIKCLIFRNEVKIYEALLKLAAPKALIIVVSCSNEAIIKAAKKRFIPVIELQHGSPSRGKLNYDYSSGIGKEYFPDYFFAFGQPFFSNAKLPIDPSRIRNIGYKYLEEKRTQFASSAKLRAILIISQPDWDRRIIEYLNDCSFIYGRVVDVRLHPGYFGIVPSIFGELCRFKVGFIDNDREELYQSIMESEFVIGADSTALIESAALGVPSYFIGSIDLASKDALRRSGVRELDKGRLLGFETVVGPIEISKKISFEDALGDVIGG